MQKTGHIVAALSAALALLLPTPARAELFSCTIVDVYMLDEGGAMISSTFDEAEKETTILVDTETGTVKHALFGNTSYYQRVIVDHGSNVSSFKVVAASPEGSRPDDGVSSFRNMTVFQLNTFDEGSSKTFWASEGGHFGSGYCQ